MDANEVAARAWDMRVNMMRVALSILPQGADAEDAVSEAIFKACRYSHQIREEQSFKPWIMRILARNCYDALRKRKDEVLADDLSAYETPVIKGAEGSVLELIQELPATIGKVLVLHYYEGFKAWEIARILSMPLGTVLVTLYRGRGKLRAMLEKEEADYAKQRV